VMSPVIETARARAGTPGPASVKDPGPPRYIESTFGRVKLKGF